MVARDTRGSAHRVCLNQPLKAFSQVSFTSLSSSISKTLQNLLSTLSKLKGKKTNKKVSLKLKVQPYTFCSKSTLFYLAHKLDSPSFQLVCKWIWSWITNESLWFYQNITYIIRIILENSEISFISLNRNSLFCIQANYVHTLVVCCGLRVSPWRRCIAAWSFSASPHLATLPTTSKKVGWGIPAAFFGACGEESN